MRRLPTQLTTMPFLDGLPVSLKEMFWEEMRISWSRHTCALDGNPLTDDEARMVIEKGLAAGNGATLVQNCEIESHAQAIDRLHQLIGKRLYEDDLISLHKAMLPEPLIHGPLKPTGILREGASDNAPKASAEAQNVTPHIPPGGIPALMRAFVKAMSPRIAGPASLEAALAAYAQIHLAFTSVRPFGQGNRRFARLIANLPLLNAGHAPIVILLDNREAYIRHTAGLQATAPESSMAVKEQFDRPLDPGFLTFLRRCREEESVRFLDDMRGALRRQEQGRAAGARASVA